MDERDLYDTKIMLMNGAALFVFFVLFGWGSAKLYLGSSGKRVFDDYLTITELENNIRRIRIENAQLEEKLASLKTKVD
jgi:hypothetical protein